MAFTRHEYKGIRWSASDKIGVKHLFTEKLGGVGDRPYSSVYDPEWLQPESQQRVRELWQTLCRGAELPEGLCLTRQIHSDIVRHVGAEEMVLPPLDKLPVDCDGLCTTERGVPLVVFGADCLPVLLCDETAGVIAALHCGWKGTAKDMAGAGVRAMLEKGARADRICAALGPGISGCCFETGPEVPEAMTALLGGDADGTFWPENGVPGKFMVDLKEANRRRLLQLGLLPENIDTLPDCTMCETDRYWSHRGHKGVRGTQASIIML
ncbi:MAG: laccase domain-containing protein [Ruminococcaceae bacterium]|nr:laccase domain-containing protein [Oscillospiraceae bacterium]